MNATNSSRTGYPTYGLWRERQIPPSPPSWLLETPEGLRIPIALPQSMLSSLAHLTGPQVCTVDGALGIRLWNDLTRPFTESDIENSTQSHRLSPPKAFFAPDAHVRPTSAAQPLIKGWPALTDNAEVKKRSVVLPHLDQAMKIYCTHWIATGGCHYMQQGCKFKHEMPSQQKLTELGFPTVPKWWLEGQAKQNRVKIQSEKLAKIRNAPSEASSDDDSDSDSVIQKGRCKVKNEALSHAGSPPTTSLEYIGVVPRKFQTSQNQLTGITHPAREAKASLRDWRAMIPTVLPSSSLSSSQPSLENLPSTPSDDIPMPPSKLQINFDDSFRYPEQSLTAAPTSALIPFPAPLPTNASPQGLERSKYAPASLITRSSVGRHYKPADFTRLRANSIQERTNSFKDETKASLVGSPSGTGFATSKRVKGQD